jgi:hypothetical protein
LLRHVQLSPAPDGDGAAVPSQVAQGAEGPQEIRLNRSIIAAAWSSASALWQGGSHFASDWCRRSLVALSKPRRDAIVKGMSEADMVRKWGAASTASTPSR